VTGRRAEQVRALVARRLERGGEGPWPARIAARAWEAWSAQTVARPLRLPPGARVIGVGGAVLGGAGKTPLAVALARALAGTGERPALVGHAYRARPGGGRVVNARDLVAEVGDDALSAARLLGGDGPVVVGDTRQAAVDHAAASGHRVLVVDGLLQTAPVRLWGSVLVLDGTAPWGAGACPPLGDLRAPPPALLGAAGVVAAIQPEGTEPSPALPPDAIAVPSRIAGAVPPSGERISPGALRRMRLGLIVAVARPARISAALERAGVGLRATVFLADHEVPDRAVLARAGRADVEAWLTTARCATKLPGALGGRPVLALDHHLDVGDLVRRLFGPAAPPC
jgi:tetraacyldisaccharide 4'-kinase